VIFVTGVDYRRKNRANEAPPKRIPSDLAFYCSQGVADMFEIPADISPDTTGWLISLVIAVVFVAVIALIGFWLSR